MLFGRDESEVKDQPLNASAVKLSFMCFTPVIVPLSGDVNSFKIYKVNAIGANIY
jgi:hypothetical protein